MKSTISTTVTLVLDQKEALYLRELVQNPLTQNEDTESREIRARFWQALESITLQPHEVMK